MDNFLLENKFAKKLYKQVKDLPIIDYHCHLSPKEIYEDKPFDNIGELWLSGDHYKWRLMRSVGIDEEYITGNASWHDKFVKYAFSLEYAIENPLYHWSNMELKAVFDIDTFLNSSNAEEIWEKANDYIKKNNLSPRKIIEKFKVQTICTTDDITDSLEFHELIRKDNSVNFKVLPSFRTDNLLLMGRSDYPEYLDKLSAVSDVQISDLQSLKQAVQTRLDFFTKSGCVFTDVGIQYFPNCVYDDETAEKVFKNVLKQKEISQDDYLGLLGNLYLFLGEEYKKRNLIMQMHLNVKRNANSLLFDTLGADCGGDCIGDITDTDDLIKVLDAVNSKCGLPETIIYTLNSAACSKLASIAGSFRNVRLGAAWWFCDNKRGIYEQLNTIAENFSLGQFYGMLTDSRSFLSYTRHDYFRRILCSFIGEKCEKAEYPKESAFKLCEKICYKNINEILR